MILLKAMFALFLFNALLLVVSAVFSIVVWVVLIIYDLIMDFIRNERN